MHVRTISFHFIPNETLFIDFLGNFDSHVRLILLAINDSNFNLCIHLNMIMKYNQSFIWNTFIELLSRLQIQMLRNIDSIFKDSNPNTLNASFNYTLTP